MKNILVGAFDLHVHTAPDVVKRKFSDLELARRLLAHGMAGCAIKNHFFDTAARAQLLCEQFPQLKVAGGVVLNRSVGGLNPQAVERCGQAGGRLVWFPTLEARSYQAYQQRLNQQADLDPYISVCDGEGKLLPQAMAVLEVAAKYHMTVGTGHISADEGLAVVRAAVALGCTVVLTHADNPADCYTVEQQEEAVSLGAYVEHSYFTTFHHRTSIEEVARQIRAVGCERVLLTSDFGQPNSPYPDEGLAEYADLLLGQGFSQTEVVTMLREVPERLLE